MNEAMRAAFEAWYSGNGNWPKSVEKDGNGNYRLAQAASAWHTFQAAAAIEREALRRCARNRRESASMERLQIPVSIAQTPSEREMRHENRP